MTRFKIEFNFDVNPNLYNSYCKFIFKLVQRSIKRSINPKKYRVREPLVLKSPLIKWIGDPPKHINLTYYVTHCLELKKVKGVYEIRLNDKLRIPHTKTRVSTLIRMLEYGTNSIPALPVIRRVMLIYSLTYPAYLIEYLKERWLFR